VRQRVADYLRSMAKADVAVDVVVDEVAAP
jgi:hypothetical protein